MSGGTRSLPLEPLKPVFKKWDQDAGAWIWGLTAQDFDRVRKGYACDRCLEPFPFPMPVCPVCKNDIEIIVDTPPEWK